MAGRPRGSCVLATSPRRCKPSIRTEGSALFAGPWNRSFMRQTLRRWVVAPAFPGLLAGCPKATGLPDAAVNLTILEDTVRAIRDPTHITLELRLLVENRDAQPIYVGPCGHALYQRTGTTDRVVYAVPCRAGSSLNLVVEPGLGSVIGVRVVARRDTVAGRWPAVGVEGDYYVIAWLLSSPGAGGIGSVPLPQGRRTSPPFPVREREVGLASRGVPNGKEANLVAVAPAKAGCPVSFAGSAHEYDTELRLPAYDRRGHASPEQRMPC